MSESAIGECVDHVSSLFVNFDPVKVPRLFGDLNSRGISRELPHPAEFGVELTND